MKIALALRKVGLKSDILHSLGLASILGALSLWGRSARQTDEKEAARAERLAMFVGLWPPTFFLLGKVLQDLEASPAEQTLRARGVEGPELDQALREHAGVAARP